MLGDWQGKMCIDNLWFCAMRKNLIWSLLDFQNVSSTEHKNQSLLFFCVRCIHMMQYWSLLLVSVLLQTIHITNVKVKGSGAVESAWQQGHIVPGVLRRWMASEILCDFFFGGFAVNWTPSIFLVHKKFFSSPNLFPLTERCLVDIEISNLFEWRPWKVSSGWVKS